MILGDIFTAELPHTIPRSSFERDLDFYGLGTKEGDIKDNSLRAVLASLQAAKVKRDMLLLAIEAHNQYAFNININSSHSQFFSVTVNDLLDKLGRKGGFNEEERGLFVNYLDLYFGLKAKYQQYSPASYHISRK